MSISIISILSTCIVLFWLNPRNPKTETILTQNHQKTIHSNSAKVEQNQPNATFIPLSLSDNLPLPIIDNNSVTLKNDEVKTVHSTLDSLGPKETFTEYKLEIKKENSEQEIKKLKTELAQYGIRMDIFELSYNNDNHIKRFKGQFKTDSLFCGSNMDNYQFDISGSFKTMEFIFRVANQKDLKYLKIQSDDFEETIECYDDKVIANTKEAEKMNMLMKREIAIAQAEMARARAEIDRAKAEMDRELRLKAERDKLTEKELKTLERLDSINWEDISLKIERELGKKFKGKKMEDLHDALKDLNIRIETEVNDAMRQLELELRNMKIEIEEAIDKEFNKNQRLENKEQERSAQELEKEARELEEEAKRLRKEAKEKAKEARKKSNG